MLHLMEKEMATTPVFSPGKSHGQRSAVGSSPEGRKESDTTGHKHACCTIFILQDRNAYHITQNQFGDFSEL